MQLYRALSTSAAIILMIAVILSTASTAKSQQFNPPNTISVTMYQLNPIDSSPVSLCLPNNGNRNSYGCTWDPDYDYPYAQNPVTVSIEDDYLLDVVPRELNPEEGYHPTAIKAQAVAARSYAYSRINSGASINNSTQFQVFVPYFFDRLGLSSSASLNNPYSPNEDPYPFRGVRPQPTASESQITN